MTSTSLTERHVFITNEQTSMPGTIFGDVIAAIAPFAIDGVVYTVSPVTMYNVQGGVVTFDFQGYDCYIFTTNDAAAVSAIQTVQTNDSTTFTMWSTGSTYGN